MISFEEGVFQGCHWFSKKQQNHKSVGRLASADFLRPLVFRLFSALIERSQGCITSSPSSHLDNKKHLEEEQRVQNTPIPTPEELQDEECSEKLDTIVSGGRSLSLLFLVESVIITFCSQGHLIFQLKLRSFCHCLVLSFRFVLFPGRSIMSAVLSARTFKAFSDFNIFFCSVL